MLWLTGGLEGTVGALYVTLQLKRSWILSVTMLTCSVTLPALAVLLLQLEMMFHVVHEPEWEEKEQRDEEQRMALQTNTGGILTRALSQMEHCMCTCGLKNLR